MVKKTLLTLMATTLFVQFAIPAFANDDNKKWAPPQIVDNAEVKKNVPKSPAVDDITVWKDAKQNVFDDKGQIKRPKSKEQDRYVQYRHLPVKTDGIDNEELLLDDVDADILDLLEGLALKYKEDTDDESIDEGLRAIRKIQAHIFMLKKDRLGTADPARNEEIVDKGIPPARSEFSERYTLVGSALDTGYIWGYDSKTVVRTGRMISAWIVTTDLNGGYGSTEAPWWKDTTLEERDKVHHIALRTTFDIATTYQTIQSVVLYDDNGAPMKMIRPTSPCVGFIDSYPIVPDSGHELIFFSLDTTGH